MHAWIDILDWMSRTLGLESMVLGLSGMVLPLVRRCRCGLEPHSRWWYNELGRETKLLNRNCLTALLNQKPSPESWIYNPLISKNKMGEDDMPMDDKAKRMRDLLSSFYSPDPSVTNANNPFKLASLDVINTTSFDADQYMNLLVRLLFIYLFILKLKLIFLIFLFLIN